MKVGQITEIAMRISVVVSVHRAHWHRIVWPMTGSAHDNGWFSLVATEFGLVASVHGLIRQKRQKPAEDNMP